MDDDPKALELLEEALRSAGYETQAVRSGTRALEVLANKVVGAILLDLLMPGMDGFQVIRHVRQEPAFRELPILVMTAKNLSQDEIALLNRETQGLLQKDGSWKEQLIAEVGRVVRGHSLAKICGTAMIKVLIAEDNAVNRELLRELLELRGYTVLEACDGQEALRIIEQTQPELLLLDIGMPVMDGFAVIRRIRENPRLAKLPVVAVTAYAMRGDQERILNSGFDGYLSKPVNPSSLAEELDRVLTKGSQPTKPD